MKFKFDLLQIVKIFRSILLLSVVLISNSVFSQITSLNADYSTLSEYTSSPQDSIYVFCDKIGTGVGELRADSPDGTSGWTFTWTKWDETATDFTTIIITENGMSSIITNLSDGLYKVLISKSGETDVEDQAWVLNNSNSNPILNLDLLDCVGVHFKSTFTKKNLQYFDIPSTSLLNVSVDDRIIFTLSRNGAIVQSTPISNYDGSDKSFIDTEAYEGDDTYLMLVSDQYACEFTSDVVSTPTYAVKADFAVNPETGEAPLDVEFTNATVNATDYEWFLYQDYDRIDEGALITEDSLLLNDILIDENIDPYTYQHPGNYFVKLIVKSDKGPDVCVDEMILTTPIVVDTSLVQVPNVFTPNGDGKNDVWRAKSQSLKSFHAIVFNRWGRVVYEWKNPDEGWNGKVNGKWATPGTYFYVITAVGREEQTKKYTKKGSFMLIRK